MSWLCDDPITYIKHNKFCPVCVCLSIHLSRSCCPCWILKCGGLETFDCNSKLAKKHKKNLLLLFINKYLLTSLKKTQQPLKWQCINKTDYRPLNELLVWKLLWLLVNKSYKDHTLVNKFFFFRFNSVDKF